MRLNRFLPLVVPLLTWIFLEIYYFYSRMIYVVSVLVVLLFFFAIRQFLKESKREDKLRNLIILPSVFTVGLIAFSSLLPKSFLVLNIFFIINVVFAYFYFRTIYYYLIKTKMYRLYYLQNLASYGNFLAFYFVSSSIFGLQSFLNLSIEALMIVLLTVTALVVYQVMWANRIISPKGFFYILMICLIIMEIAWAASFLTLSYYILGLIITVCYYILIGLIRFHLLDKLDKRIIKLYLTFGLSSILVVLLTARWL